MIPAKDYKSFFMHPVTTPSNDLPKVSGNHHSSTMGRQLAWVGGYDNRYIYDSRSAISILSCKWEASH